MVKIFSVDWMAQSHHGITSKEDMGLVDMTTQSKPHVPCMVQPRPPTSYEKIYLQPKPKSTRIEHTDSIEKTHQSSSLDSSLHPTICSSPSLSENSGYSSGYESEAASIPECPSVEEGSDGERDGAQRRMRTKFTPDQIHKMEKIFNKHKYLDAGERAKTALKLNLSETQVRTWFQNRRMKLKREVLDVRAEYLAPALNSVVFQHMHPFQYPGFGGQQQLPYAPANHALYQPVVAHMSMPQMLSRQPQQTMMSSPHYYQEMHPRD